MFDAELLKRIRENDPTLTTIALSNNNISDAGASAIAKALETNKTLTSIALSSNKISDAGAKDLAKALETNKTLTTIYLKGNYISDAGASVIAKALETNKTLTSIALSSNKISDAGASALAKALETNKTLTSIDLYKNQISAAGAKDLAKALETNKTLTTIRLESNKISDAGAKELAKALETNQTLTDIGLSNSKISNAGASAIAKALETNKRLTSIALNENQISDAGAKDLAKALETNQTLTDIDLYKNQISAAGAKELAKALETNQTLTDIDLSNSKISDAGASAIAKALETNKRLTSIALSDNQISDAGAKALAKALETNQTLTDIDLKRNSIRAAGASVLAKALETNQTLNSIHLSKNFIGDAGANALAKALETNKTLTHINFRDNEISAVGASALAKMLETNKTLTSIVLSENQISAALEEAIAGLRERNAALRDSLFKAIDKGDLKEVKAKLQAGVSMFATDNKGNNGLHQAVMANKPDIAKYIFAEMANYYPNPLALTNNDGKTPLDLAKEKGHQAIIALLSQTQAAQDKPKDVIIHKPLPTAPIVKAKNTAPVLATALYDYQAQRPDELTFKAGNPLIILEQKLGGWWLAEFEGKQGQIPSNYVEIHKSLPASPKLPAVSANRGKIAAKPIEKLEKQKIGISIGTLSDDARSSGQAKSASKGLLSKTTSQPKQVAKPKEARMSEMGTIGINIQIEYQALEFIMIDEDTRAMLGQGTFGCVYKAIYQGTAVAVKELHQQILSKENIQELIDEASVMKKVDSPRIVHCYGICLGPYALVIEYMPGGTLEKFLYDPRKPLSWKACYQIGLDMAEGMKFLHAKQIVHGDFKSGNVLLDKEGRARIADFGGSKLRLTTEINSSMKSMTLFGKKVGGSLNYLAPELFQELQVVGDTIQGFTAKASTTQATDIYSFGLVLCETTTRKSPFIEKTHGPYRLTVENFKAAIIAGLQEKPNPETPPALKDVIQQCLFKNPKQRLPVAKALDEMKAEDKQLSPVFGSQLILKR